MGRKVDADDLVGTLEIAARLGVSRTQVVHAWRQRHPDFPQPIAVVSRTLVWDWKQVERWAKATGRLP